MCPCMDHVSLCDSVLAKLLCVSWHHSSNQLETWGRSKMPQEATGTSQGLWQVSLYDIITNRAWQHNVRQTNVCMSLEEDPLLCILSCACLAEYFYTCFCFSETFFHVSTIVKHPFTFVCFRKSLLRMSAPAKYDLTQLLSKEIIRSYFIHWLKVSTSWKPLCFFYCQITSLHDDILLNYPSFSY